LSDAKGQHCGGWYLRSLYRLFRWYKNAFDGASVPHATASIIFAACHYGNAGSALLLYAKLTRKGVGWTIGASSKLTLIGGVVMLVYTFVFAGVLERMEASITKDDEDSLQEFSHTGVPLYVVFSILALIGTIIYMAV
jgi:hypothetical protein